MCPASLSRLAGLLRTPLSCSSHGRAGGAGAAGPAAATDEVALAARRVMSSPVAIDCRRISILTASVRGSAAAGAAVPGGIDAAARAGVGVAPAAAGRGESFEPPIGAADGGAAVHALGEREGVCTAGADTGASVAGVGGVSATGAAGGGGGVARAGGAMRGGERGLGSDADGAMNASGAKGLGVCTGDWCRAAGEGGCPSGARAAAAPLGAGRSSFSATPYRRRRSAAAAGTGGCGGPSGRS